MVNDQEKYFVYNGKKSSDFGVWASELGLLESPAKRVEVIEVAGRNGDIIIEDGSYENVKLKFKDCFMIEDFSKNFNRLKAFLYRQKGYQRLETPWLPDEYRLATFEGDIEPTVRVWEGFGKFDLTFNCKPQRFLKSGEEPITVIPPIAGLPSTPTYVYPTSFPESVTPANRWTLAVTILEAPSPVPFFARYTVVDAGEEFTSDSETYTPTIGERIEIPLDNSLGTVKKWRIMFSVSDTVFANSKVRVEGYATVGNGEFMYLDGICARDFSILNPTGFACKPIFDIYGGYFALQDIDIQNGDKWIINSWDSSAITMKMTMDCENEYLYYDNNGTKVNLTQYMDITHEDKDYNTLPLSFPLLGEVETIFHQYLPTNYEGSFFVMYPHWFTI